MKLQQSIQTVDAIYKKNIWAFHTKQKRPLWIVLVKYGVACDREISGCSSTNPISSGG
jgi:hypothetical protein